MLNLAFPPRDRETRAIDRDLRDQERLDHIAGVILEALDALIPDMRDLESPRARWQPDDLVVALQEQLTSLRWEQQMLHGPLVIEDEDTP